jgi:serine/threonine-protein kinase
MADHIGRVLGGRYRLLAPIGTGASAHVFLADDTRLGRRVAVKVLHPALADEAAFLRRFGAEARAAAALNHPNVLAVYDWGEEADGPYLVTEFLAGGSLRSMLDRGHRLTLSQALEVGLEAARGLDYAHRRGLVHRDIKPANLLFDEDGRLRIADFGLARALAEAAWTEPLGAVLGTARYAAPEQASGGALDGKADVYALAVVLVEAVTGRVPQVADTAMGTLMGRQGRPLEVPPDLGPLAPVLVRAGQADPAERSDAMAFGTALRQVAADLPSPEPLPLAGLAALDEVRAVDDDPTELGARGPALSAPASGAYDPTVSLPVPPPEPAPGPEPGLEPERQPSRRERKRAEKAARREAREAGDGFASPAGERRRRRWPVVLLVLLLLGAGGGATYLYVTDWRIPAHAVPVVAGMDAAAAAQTLRDLRFEVREQQERVDGTVKGQAVRTDPPAHVPVKEGKVVVLVVSAGQTIVQVPEVVGLTLEEAAATFEGVGLPVAQPVAHDYHEDVEAGRVFRSGQEPGTELEKGTAVGLYVSRGPRPRIVPQTAGKPYADARTAVYNERLVVSERVDVFHATVPEGQVVSSNPPAGTEVPRDSHVVLTVSKGLPTVPNLVGMTAADAGAALQAAGLRVGQVYGPSGGKVFLATQPAGTRVPPGTTVDVYVAP